MQVKSAIIIHNYLVYFTNSHLQICLIFIDFK